MTLDSLLARPEKRRPGTGEQLRRLGVDIGYEDRSVPGPPGGPDVDVTVLRPRDQSEAAPILINLHGGGLITGHRSQDTARLVRFVDDLGFVVVNVEYRLAPAHPFPSAVEDAYAALVWTASEARGLGGDPGRIVLMGSSAGGGLAAGTALLARDRGGPAVAGLLLLYPMLDDRNQTVSSHQVTLATWTRSDNELAWRCVLGDSADGPGVSPYAAPARAVSYAGLPPAYVEAGTADIFRDEDVAFASRAWQDGVPVHLTVFGGTPHGHDVLVSASPFASAAYDSRTWWLRTFLGRPGAIDRLPHTVVNAVREYPQER